MRDKDEWMDGWMNRVKFCARPLCGLEWTIELNSTTLSHLFKILGRCRSRQKTIRGRLRFLPCSRAWRPVIRSCLHVKVLSPDVISLRERYLVSSTEYFVLSSPFSITLPCSRRFPCPSSSIPLPYYNHSSLLLYSVLRTPY